MAVRLEQHTGTGVRSKQIVRFDQWRVIEGRQMLGYLSFKPGSRICFVIPNLDPLEKKRIEEEALALTGWDEIGSSVQAPEVPPELRKKEDDEDYDDIDA